MASQSSSHSPPGDQPRRRTYHDLINDDTLWDMRDIADNLDVQYQTVKSWRRDQTAAAGGNQPHPDMLPPAYVIKSGKPLWHAGVVRLWAMQTGRMTNEGVPRRSKPRGRPRGRTPRKGGASPTQAAA